MARGRWLKKVAQKAKNRFEEVKDLVQTQDGGMDGEGLMAILQGDFSALATADWAPSVVSDIQTRGRTCAQVAQETMELCDATQTKSQKMVDFGQNIQRTLESMSDASSLETIKALTDGEKLKEAMEIAQDMDVIALGCLDKSVEMMDLMEEAMESMPESMEKVVDKLAEQQSDEDDVVEKLDLEAVNRDVEDVQTCIRELSQLNIRTAFQVGLQAFQQLSSKAQSARSNFQTIRGFSTNVRDITQDFATFNVMALASKVKDILKCIRLTEAMRVLAEGAKRIMQVLIRLFQAMADKISTLWSALAFAKDCMADCLKYVVETRSLVLNAHEQSRSLVTKSQSVMNQLQSVKKINRESFQTVRQLGTGGEISEAIELARNMDNLIVECTSNVGSMVDLVSEGFQNLPPILTEGLNMEEEGKEEGDPEPVDVEEDIQELEKSRQAMEDSDILTACTSGIASFRSVSSKSELCSEMLVDIRDFSTNCNRTIDSFLGAWDLESAATKIHEMCRMVSVGELIKRFARQVKRLVMAMIDLLKVSLDKFSNLKLSDLSVDDMVSGAVGNVFGEKVGDAVGDKMDQAMDKIGGKFNKLFKR